MQPATMETGLDLSPAILDRFQELLVTIRGKLREWGVEGKEKGRPELSHVPGRSV